jgi:hypothetical protein
MVIGQNLTQSRKGAKKMEEKRLVATSAIDSKSFFSKTPLRLSVFA